MTTTKTSPTLLDMDTEAARIREVVRQWAEAINLAQAERSARDSEKG